MVTDLPNNLKIPSNITYIQGTNGVWEPEFESDFDKAVYYAGKSPNPRSKNQKNVIKWIYSIGISFDEIKDHRKKILAKLKDLTTKDGAWDDYPNVLVPPVFQSFSIEQDEEDDDEMPEGLDDLIKDIGGRDTPDPPGALTTIPKKPDDLVDEEIDSQILSILGLEDVFDLTYEEYASLLKEAAIKGRMSDSQMTTESIELVTNELKRVKGKTGKFKVKQKKVNINKVFNRKPGAIVKTDKLKIDNQQQNVDNVNDSTAEALQKEFLDGMGRILDSLVVVRTSLENQKNIDKKSEEIDRKQEQKNKKKEREEKIEKKKKLNFRLPSAIKRPLQNFFDIIKRYFTNILIGSVVLAAFKWLKDPNNQQKIDDFTNFFVESVPNILKGILAIVALRVGYKLFKLVKGLYDAFKWINKKIRPKPGGIPGGRSGQPNAGSRSKPTSSQNRPKPNDRTGPPITGDVDKGNRGRPRVKPSANFKGLFRSGALSVAFGAFNYGSRKSDGQTEDQAILGAASETLAGTAGFNASAAVAAKVFSPVLGIPIPGARLVYGGLVLGAGLYGSSLAAGAAGGLSDKLTGVDDSSEESEKEQRKRKKRQSSTVQPRQSLVPRSTDYELGETVPGGSFIQGNTGESRGDHFHIGPEMELWGKEEGKMEARRAAFKVAKALIDKKEPFTFTNASISINPNNPPDDATLKEYIEMEQAAHAARPGGGSFGGIDMAGRTGLPMPLGVSDVRDRDDGFGISGTISGTRAFVGHGMKGSTATVGVTAVQPGSIAAKSVPPPNRYRENRPIVIPSPKSNGQIQNQSSPSQSRVPSFSSEDPYNMTTMVVKAIYNVVG